MYLYDLYITKFTYLSVSVLHAFHFLKLFFKGCIIFNHMDVNLFIYLFIWLRWVFVAACGLSLVVRGGYSSLRCVGFSLWWLLLLRSTVSMCEGFCSCGSWALELRLSSCGSRALERRLSSCGSRA